MKVSPIILKSCPKNYTHDLDKAISPQETIIWVLEKLGQLDLDILAEARRIDNGRLGIPVYLGVCGQDALSVMPTRKQMGKGSSPEQAKASAIMELMERYAFFSFWERGENMVNATWKQAEQLFGSQLIPIEEILHSVQDNMAAEQARELMNLAEWQFYPATRLNEGEIVWLPLDWFRMLGEFNGSSAGNTDEESLLQGISELIERHVSCLVDRYRPDLPTIDPQSCHDPVFSALVRTFRDNGIKLVLKDISLGMPLPTVAALAWDPATFPASSEIVFTAGTASTPLKAAIRAITEVAQLAGDFCSNACYEASGLPKFTSLGECAWLLEGPLVSLDSLPTVENKDIFVELQAVLRALAPIEVYGIATTNPHLNVPAHYCIAPGLEFRERDKNRSLGLFIGRKLAEQAEPDKAAQGLDVLSQICPQAHYLPFFQGLLALRTGEAAKAAKFFSSSISLQPENDAKALAAFYCAYAFTTLNEWEKAIPFLRQAVQYCPQMKEYLNLLGVAWFKLGNYMEAEKCFDAALKVDKGSAMDLANRGLCRKFLGEREKAHADLTAALELDPTIAFAREHLLELEETM